MNFKRQDSAKGIDGNDGQILSGATTAKRRRLVPLMMVGLAVAVIAIALVPAQQGAARPTFTGGACSSTYSGCHDGAQTPSMMTVTGLPGGTYIPGQPYDIKITITDTNGAATGENAFDLLVNSGSLSSTDPNVEIVNPASEAKANTGVDLRLATTFNVTWTAPLSGTATFEIWAVMGDGAGSAHDIWDRETYSFGTVPEFPMILIPIVGVGLAVILALRLSKKK